MNIWVQRDRHAVIRDEQELKKGENASKEYNLEQQKKRLEEFNDSRKDDAAGEDLDEGSPEVPQETPEETPDRPYVMPGDVTPDEVLWPEDKRYDVPSPKEVFDALKEEEIPIEAPVIVLTEADELPKWEPIAEGKRVNKKARVDGLKNWSPTDCDHMAKSLYECRSNKAWPPRPSDMEHPNFSLPNGKTREEVARFVKTLYVQFDDAEGENQWGPLARQSATQVIRGDQWVDDGRDDPSTRVIMKEEPCSQRYMFNAQISSQRNVEWFNGWPIGTVTTDYVTHVGGIEKWSKGSVDGIFLPWTPYLVEKTPKEYAAAYHVDVGLDPRALYAMEHAVRAATSTECAIRSGFIQYMDALDVEYDTFAEHSHGFTPFMQRVKEQLHSLLNSYMKRHMERMCEVHKLSRRTEEGIAKAGEAGEKSSCLIQRVNELEESLTQAKNENAELLEDKKNLNESLQQAMERTKEQKDKVSSERRLKKEEKVKNASMKRTLIEKNTELAKQKLENESLRKKQKVEEKAESESDTSEISVDDDPERKEHVIAYLQQKCDDLKMQLDLRDDELEMAEYRKQEAKDYAFRRGVVEGQYRLWDDAEKRTRLDMCEEAKRTYDDMVHGWNEQAKKYLQVNNDPPDETPIHSMFIGGSTLPMGIQGAWPSHLYGLNSYQQQPVQDMFLANGVPNPLYGDGTAVTAWTQDVEHGLQQDVQQVNPLAFLQPRKTEETDCPLSLDKLAEQPAVPQDVEMPDFKSNLLFKGDVIESNLDDDVFEEHIMAKLKPTVDYENQIMRVKKKVEIGQKFINKHHQHDLGPGHKTFPGVYKKLSGGVPCDVEGQAVLCSIDHVKLQYDENGQPLKYTDKPGCDPIPEAFKDKVKQTMMLNRVKIIQNDDGTFYFPPDDLENPYNKFVALPDVSFRGYGGLEEPDLGNALYGGDVFDAQNELGTICVAWVMENEKPSRWDWRMDEWRSNDKVVFRIWPLIWMSEKKAKEGYAVRCPMDIKQWVDIVQVGKKNGWYRKKSSLPAGAWTRDVGWTGSDGGWSNEDQTYQGFYDNLTPWG